MDRSWKFHAFKLDAFYYDYLAHSHALKMRMVYQGLGGIVLHLHPIIWLILLLEEDLRQGPPAPHHPGPPGVLGEVRDDGHRVRSLRFICLHHLHQLERGLGTEFIPPECCVVCADRNGILRSIMNYSSQVSRESPINRAWWLWWSHINRVTSINMRSNTTVDYRLLKIEKYKRTEELRWISKAVRIEAKLINLFPEKDLRRK